MTADRPGPGDEQPTQPVPVHARDRRVERLERRIEKVERYGQQRSDTVLQPSDTAQQQAVQAAQVASAIQAGHMKPPPPTEARAYPASTTSAPAQPPLPPPRTGMTTAHVRASAGAGAVPSSDSGSDVVIAGQNATGDPAAESNRDSRRHHGGTHRRRLRLTGMRTRLLAGFAAVALATASIITGSSYLLMRNNLIKQVQSNAQSQLMEDVDQNGAQMVAASGPQLSEVANQIARNGGIVVLISADGTGTSDSEFSTQVPLAFQEAAQQNLVQQRVQVEGTPYELTGAQLGTNGPQIYLFTSLASEQAVLTKLITIGVASAGLALFAAIIVAFLATRNVLVPIRRLGLAARRLGEGDLDVRLTVKGSDEIADVSRTFNETAAALSRSMDELRAMDAASRRFVADVSHELRTPLTAMTAVTEVLEDVEGADVTTVSAAHLIANETKRLARLVEDLMEISRFDAGTASMRLEEINLPELLSATLAARGWTSKATVTSPTRLGVLVDARRLDVVIANLVGNALRHGGEPVAVDVWEDEGWATVQVADSGPGVPPDALPHIFDRFYKADRARGRSEGSGLGLAIAFENTRMHGGELSVRNRPEGGAVFTLRFPVRAGVVEPEPAPGLAGLPESRPGGLGSGSWRRPGGTGSGSGGQVEEVNA